VGLAVIIGVSPITDLLRGAQGGAPTPARSPAALGTRMPVQGQAHIAPGQGHPLYNSSPPTSGWHYPTPARWGIYPSPLEDEVQVHNLEHGGVVIQYNTQDTELIAKLEALAKKQSNFPCYLIVAPYANILNLQTQTRHPIALTAWGVIDYLDGYNEERIQKFIDAYRDRGPEKVVCVEGR
jgi:hypothetical protein